MVYSPEQPAQFISYNPEKCLEKIVLLNSILVVKLIDFQLCPKQATPRHP